MADNFSMDFNCVLVSGAVTAQYPSTALFVTKHEWGRKEAADNPINPQQDANLSRQRFGTHSAWGESSSPHDELPSLGLWCNCAD